MQAYRIVPGSDIRGLEVFDAPSRQPSAHEVRVRVRAVSLNYRDLMFARGAYRTSRSEAVIPCSDGAGEVIAVGAEVSRFQVGDRVIASFFPRWIDGAPTPGKTTGALGADADGVLAEEVVLHEEALTAIPSHLDFAEASTLPCAGVTAWNALFVASALKPGDSVLLLGTGGVSIFGLQLAKAAGLHAMITSSSDAKLERALELGADRVINYRSVPE
jgi:NADPH:quinone reductase-like Zn-dependent oxidoreductase